MDKIQDALSWAKAQLVESESAGLDGRLLLAHCLQREVVYLHTWPEKVLDQDCWQQFSELVAQRKLGHPIAHLLGYREFWTLTLNSNPSTLIPRPETELLVETALGLPLPEEARVLDLGTGTGAIALALASERVKWQIKGVDCQEAAVTLAKQNAELNKLSHVHMMQSDWFSALEHECFDMIVTNPPYVEQESHYLEQGDVRFEPLSALTSGADGLDDIRQIISQSPQHLLANAYLVIEHGYLQGRPIRQLLIEAGFVDVETLCDLAGLDRLSLGRKEI